MNQMDRSLLNAYYAPLEQRRKRMQSALSAEFPITAGWFNGHFRRDAANQYEMDFFPIPVVSVTGVCDVELHFDTISVTTKLRREKALSCDLTLFEDVLFEAYGVEDYLYDFRTEGTPVEEMRANIRRSSEQEVFFSFAFETDVQMDVIVSFVKQLIGCGFYY